jgi:hypothetical protein
MLVVAGQMPVKTTITTKQKNFYQLEGSIKIVIQEEGVRKEMEPTRAICICILPMFTPVRSAGSIGLVIERKRVGKGFTDDFYGTATTATTNCTK